MELITSNPLHNIVDERDVISSSNTSFIEANTKEVTLEHLKKDCIIPVFAKDNESTISHYEFVQKTREIAQDLFPEFNISEPDIRTSHLIKGRIPSAIGKPAKELKEHEKTLYYERCAFAMEIPQVVENVNGNRLALTIGGVRAYNQENLYSRKSPEKFKMFIGFKNMVCTNLCISTDGLADQIRVNSVDQLSEAVENLLNQYDRMKHLGMMERMSRYELTQTQFAHFIGKLRMYQFMDKTEQKQYFPVSLNDSQINTVVKNYYHDPNFSRKGDGSINMWRIFNLFTEANKSSYIDNNLERNVNAYDLTNDLVNSLQNGTGNFFLHN
ncbi:DUF3871 family protein [Salegentibacter mishustinae]|jgi:hypothetical protein|uniref:DUF3871 family protein n=1 Tax=Salegentibacter mishustinae TaxID=270918 RepID=UPI001CE02E6B|nr:DUF3871 family protein [Salegentibacter mishustinae]UBZ08265.1 DUF3871 family protein [Salegentibacter mishustinae]